MCVSGRVGGCWEMDAELGVLGRGKGVLDAVKSFVCAHAHTRILWWGLNTH